jgi:hypothetical protein
MADQFDQWDTFMRHYTLTRDSHKALRWTRYDQWVAKRNLPYLELAAEMELKKTLDRLDGEV